MTRTPMHPEMLSEDQRLAALKHQNEFIRDLMLMNLQLHVVLDPARLPEDIAKAVSDHMIAFSHAINMSNATLDRIFSRTPHRVSEPLQ
ncbi:hypothetical protein [Bosea sp. (in: a-proteobacteria)]